VVWIFVKPEAIIELMIADEVRKKYVEFFKEEPRNHKEISPSPLSIENDQTTLCTSAGMQQLIPNLMGEPRSEGKRLVGIQPCIRTQDIEEVGDLNHMTFFEMLGNWSLGDYFKEEQLAWIWEFFNGVLGLPKERLWVSVYAGSDQVEKDTESYEIWEKLGVPEGRICYLPDNWWSRSGLPEKMPVGEIGGPDSEVFYEFESVVDEKYGKEFHPDSKRFLEIGNSVFIQYRKTESGLEELPQKNVDFGGGLERICAALKDDPDIFKTDVFWPIIEKIEDVSGKPYGGNESEMRIIADHMRAANALAADGILPSNKLHGYVMRRLIRRAAIKMRNLKGSVDGGDFKGLTDFALVVEEVSKFRVTLEDGLEKMRKYTESKEFKWVPMTKQKVAEIAFDLYQSYGLPGDIFIEELENKHGIVPWNESELSEYQEEFEKLRRGHQERSRTASAGMFKGGLADHSQEVVRLHTVTHLLHAALRKVLGDGVSQKGSNITAERLRFDFTYPEKLTDEQVKEVEKFINDQVVKKLPVSFEVMSLEEAKRVGALAFFAGKYGEMVKVYTIGDPNGEWVSKEVCGGPHVGSLAEVGGRVKIIKQEPVSAGVRRVYARIES
jgi:alanyl-tRNA synthetase